MDQSSKLDADGEDGPQVLLNVGEHVIRREWRLRADGTRDAVLTVLPATEHFSADSLARLAHEYELKEELDSAWAARPLELEREPGRTMLVLADPGGEPLLHLLGAPVEVGRFLRLAIGITTALAAVHKRGLVHKDIKPAHILVDRTSGQAWLTGFGIASRLPSQRQAPVPPETISGTLAYMAPEQTGRMNRAIDARSDLYALGVMFYEMVTGHLPFTASEPMEWVHCHIARQPVPPSDRLENVPLPVSGIIMKLLAKTAEDRYQTAAGVERDLRRCLAAWKAHGRIEDFPFGQDDAPDRLWIAETLYGRAGEVEALITAFDRVVRNGTPELVLVSGYAGIGKSSVVNELHKALVPSRGLFASGKFDQYKRDIPYSTLIQAFQSLVRPLLGLNERELMDWRQALLEALGPNARLITDLIPELRLVIGEQAAVPELPPQDAQRRFHLVFRAFIGVFARPEHPLALFLDDLQWLDAATLGLLADLLTQPDLRHLLLIGAYRDNEVNAAHPLRRKLEAIKNDGCRIEEITLAPLTQDHLGQLIADALRCEPQRAAPLTQLVHDRTAGNPFFATQFLYALAEEHLLVFDHGTLRWTWDPERIRAKGYTDNVVELMVGKLTRLPTETQKALQLLACLGNVAEITTLSIVLQTAAVQVEATLWEPLRQELIARRNGSYRFVHDRVQEAAYSLIPEASREADHLRIGRLLAARTPPEQREEAIFDIVNQLNRGANLITSADEREQLAAFNLIAAKRATSSAAYTSALTHLVAGAALLPEGAWERRHELMFALELDRARCEFLTGELAAAERRLSALSSRAADTGELATVVGLRMDLYTVLGQSSRAVAVCLEYLQRVGIRWVPDPTAGSARRAYERIWSMLGDRTIEDLISLPVMTDPVSLATLDVLTKVLSPAMSTSENLVCLAVCEAVSLSLERGNSDGSSVAYVMLGMVTSLRFGNYPDGYRFGQLAYNLVERQGLSRFRARTYVALAHNILPWTQYIRTSHELLQRGFDAANAIGDVMFAAYSRMHLNANLLAAGEALEIVQREGEYGLAFAHAAQFDLVIDVINTQLRLIRTLRGQSPKFGSLNGERFDEYRFERLLASDASLALRGCKYFILALQARYLAGDYAAALAARSKAESLLWLCPSYFETAEYHFYGALSHAASWDAAYSDRGRHFAALTTHHQQLEIWAANCRENFESRAALVGAEIARIEGRDREAMDLYEQAIQAAHAHGFIHHEALANELAAHFYAMRGFSKISLTYLRDARYLYLRWGADGKVQQLDQLYPRLSETEPTPGPTYTIDARVEHLDLATVLKVSQAVSGAVVLTNLLDTLMRTAIEQAGAERGLLVLPHEAGQQIAAEATTSGDTILVQLRDQPMTSTVLPEAIVQTVLRTQETMLLDDAIAEPALAADSYIRHRNSRSILCLPLINQSKLIGVLYLENNLAPRVFTPARISVLRLVASQAATALENTRLYHDLAEREAKIRRLVEANIIGIFVWEYEGSILEANDAFLRIIGYDRADLLSGQLRWTDLTPAEWLEHHAQRWAPEIKVTGHVQPYEKEYFRKDGSRVPVLVGATSFNETGDQGVSFVLDLTERKQAEQALRQAQTELAHLTRVMTMGELTASIAHEINQPIAALAISASACLRWLARQPPDVDQARASLQRMIRDSNRAGDVVTRVRSLVKKSPLAKVRLDLNDVLQEVLAIIEPEARRHVVLIRTELATGLPPVAGDRVQLQQVILNLAMNGIEAMKEVAGRPRELWIRSHAHTVGTVRVSVQDTGVGLAEENLGQVFEAFYTTKTEGMGMGLSISRSIIVAHGGQLWPSMNDGHGATFQFTLPTEDAHDGGQPEILTGTGPGSIRRQA
jgi:PAS domain S-box-containing protein